MLHARRQGREQAKEEIKVQSNIPSIKMKHFRETVSVSRWNDLVNIIVKAAFTSLISMGIGICPCGDTGASETLRYDVKALLHTHNIDVLPSLQYSLCLVSKINCSAGGMKLPY